MGKLIAPGYAADLVVFDPETILDMSTNEDPNHLPKGISHDLLNGTKVVESGSHLGTGEVKVIGKEN